MVETMKHCLSGWRSMTMLSMKSQQNGHMRIRDCTSQTLVGIDCSSCEPPGAKSVRMSKWRMSVSGAEGMRHKLLR